MRSPRGLSFRSRCGCPVAAFVTLTAVGGLCLLVALHPVAWPQQLPPARVSWRHRGAKAGSRRVISSTSEDDAVTVGQLPAADAGTNAVYRDASAGQQDTFGAASTVSAAALPALTASRSSESAASAHRSDAIEALPGPARRSAAETAASRPLAAAVKTSAGLSASRVGPAPEPPGHATLAICLVTRIDADDPQWVDGKAEDLHEASDFLWECGVACEKRWICLHVMACRCPASATQSSLQQVYTQDRALSAPTLIGSNGASQCMALAQPAPVPRALHGWAVHVRDEAGHLALRAWLLRLQWVEHHKRLGVGRIYVFDHGSEVPINTQFPLLLYFPGLDALDMHCRPITCGWSRVVTATTVLATRVPVHEVVIPAGASERDPQAPHCVQARAL